MHDRYRAGMNKGRSDGLAYPLRRTGHKHSLILKMFHATKRPAILTNCKRLRTSEPINLVR